MDMLNEIVHHGNHSRIVKLFDGVYFREGDLEIRGQCNCGVIELANSLAVIDYPEQWPDEEIFGEAEALLHKPVKYLIVTHAHVDHCVGLKTLRRNGIRVIASAACIEEMRAEGYPVPEVRLAVEKSMEIELEGCVFELILPGRVVHSAGDMLVGLPQHKTVFPGDLMVVEKNLFFHSSDIAAWRATVAKVSNMGWEVLCRGHGPLAGAEYFGQLARYLELLHQAKLHQAKYDEIIDKRVVHSCFQMLSPALSAIADRLLKQADAVNIGRQLNQLMERTREGY